MLAALTLYQRWSQFGQSNSAWSMHFIMWYCEVFLFLDLPSVAAHLVIDAKDKDTAFSFNIWSTAVTINPWHL